MLSARYSRNPMWLYAALIGMSAAAAVIAFAGMQAKALLAVCGLMAAGLFVMKPEYGVLAFITTFLLSYPGFLRGSGLLTPNNLLGVLFSFLLLRRVLSEGRIWFLSVPQIRWLAAIGALFIISSWAGPDTPSSLAQLDRSNKVLWDFFAQFAFLIFFIHFIQTRNHLYMVFGLVLAIILCSLPSAIHAALFQHGDYRAAATLGINMAKNSNHLAFYSLFGLVILWYFRQESSGFPAKWTSLALAGILLFVVVLSASRNALLNLMVLSLILAFEHGFAPRRILLTLAILASFALLIGHVTPKQHLDRITSFTMNPAQKEASSSLYERWDSIKTTLHIFRDTNPVIGAGPGNFRWMRQVEYDRKSVATHNAYLWALVSGGVLTLFCYLGLFWSTLRDLRRLESRPPPAEGPPLWMVKSTRTVLILFLVFSLFTEAWLEIIPFLLVGITIVMKQQHLLALGETPAT